METQNNYLELSGGGLKCDNPECDWKDETIKVGEVEAWLNAPCPKCGENVLTDQDYENLKTVLQAVRFINSLPPDALPSTDQDHIVTARIDTHKTIRLEIIDDKLKTK